MTLTSVVLALMPLVISIYLILIAFSSRWSIPFQYGIMDQHGHFSRKMFLLREETGNVIQRLDSTSVKPLHVCVDLE